VDIDIFKIDIFKDVQKVTLEVRRAERDGAHADLAIDFGDGRPLYDRLKGARAMDAGTLQRLLAAVVETLQQRALDREK
jgi:hypothetical protein